MATTEETSCDSEYTQEDDAVGLTNMVAFSLGHERDSRALIATRSRARIKGRGTLLRTDYWYTLTQHGKA